MSNVGLVHEGNEIPLYDFKGFSLLLFFTFVLFCLQFIYVYICKTQQVPSWLCREKES